MRLDRFQHQTHSLDFFSRHTGVPILCHWTPSIKHQAKTAHKGVKSNCSIILLLTSTIWVWQASFLVHSITSHPYKSQQVQFLWASFFSFLMLTTRRKIQKTQHLLRFWYKLRSPVELRSSRHTFLAKTIKLQPHHPKLHEESLTILKDPSNSLSDEQQNSFEWRNQSKNLFCFPPSQASRLTCAICIGWDRGICVIGVAAEAEMVAPAALCCWLAECCTAAASNWACACWSNNCCWAGVNVSYKQLENTAINNGKSHFSYKVIR